MATSYKDVDIKCPFFRELGGKTISCEGLTPDSIIKMWFGRTQSKDHHLGEYCVRHYEECALFKMLEAKYED